MFEGKSYLRCQNLRSLMTSACASSAAAIFHDFPALSRQYIIFLWHDEALLLRFGCWKFRRSKIQMKTNFVSPDCYLNNKMQRWNIELTLAWFKKCCFVRFSLYLIFNFEWLHVSRYYNCILDIVFLIYVVCYKRCLPFNRNMTITNISSSITLNRQRYQKDPRGWCRERDFGRCDNYICCTRCRLRLNTSR